MYANESVYYWSDNHSLIPTWKRRDFQTLWYIWSKNIFKLTLYHLGGNLSSLPGAERGFSAVKMNLCPFSQVGFFQLEHKHSKLCSLFSMELLWAWSCSKDPEMKVATFPHQLLWGEEVTVNENGSLFLMSVICERGERGWETSGWPNGTDDGGS